jgi:N-acetylmuramoyl-L-alanine amidase
MKRKLLVIMLMAIALMASMSTALAAGQERAIYADGVPLRQASATEYHSGTTYTALRPVSTALTHQASVTWENGQAVVRTPELTLTARPGNCYIEANGRYLFVPEAVKLSSGRVMIPIRVLAQAFGASVRWDAASDAVYLNSGSGTITSGDSFYDSSSVYWLSRIISAESQGESMQGQIAVGNVILNRVKSSEFPDTIYDVIFDRNWGVQFTPVAIGSIYWTPTPDSTIAAKLCLDGANVVGNALYFIDPVESKNPWVAENRPYITTIGVHNFYA